MGILRLLLALAVVLSHSSSHLSGAALPGSIAVQGFFIISGFYIALILHRKYNFSGGTRVFYEQRYLRLAPMYWLAVLCTLLAGVLCSVLVHHPAGRLAVWADHGGELSAGSVAFLGLSQVTMFGLDATMFSSLSGHPLALHYTANFATEPLAAWRFMLVPPAWSLSVELLFYLSAPFLVRRSVLFQLVVVGLSFGLRIAAVTFCGLSNDPWSYRFFPFEAGLFVLGSLAYRSLPRAESMVRRLPAITSVATTVLAAAIFGYNFIPLPDEMRRWSFLALVLLSVPLLFAATQRNTIDRWIGEMSYPLYLLHEVVLSNAEPILRRYSPSINVIATLLLPLLVAAAAYALIERPIEAWRARRFHRKSELSEF